MTIPLHFDTTKKSDIPQVLAHRYPVQLIESGQALSATRRHHVAAWMSANEPSADISSNWNDETLFRVKEQLIVTEDRLEAARAFLIDRFFESVFVKHRFIAAFEDERGVFYAYIRHVSLNVVKENTVQCFTSRLSKSLRIEDYRTLFSLLRDLPTSLEKSRKAYFDLDNLSRTLISLFDSIAMVQKKAPLKIDLSAGMFDDLVFVKSKFSDEHISFHLDYQKCLPAINYMVASQFLELEELQPVKWTPLGLMKTKVAAGIRVTRNDVGFWVLGVDNVDSTERGETVIDALLARSDLDMNESMQICAILRICTDPMEAAKAFYISGNPDEIFTPIYWVGRFSDRFGDFYAYLDKIPRRKFPMTVRFNDRDFVEQRWRMIKADIMARTSVVKNARLLHELRDAAESYQERTGMIDFAGLKDSSVHEFYAGHFSEPRLDPMQALRDFDKAELDDLFDRIA